MPVMTAIAKRTDPTSDRPENNRPETEIKLQPQFNKC